MHWEQFGELNADVQIDGNVIDIRSAMTIRDRSFGKYINDYSHIKFEFD